MEIFWTGMHAIGKKDWKMTGKSSLWMFPIYGMAACIGPVSRKLGEVPVFVRGSIYMLGIFAAEYSGRNASEKVSSLSMGLQSGSL